MEQVKEGPQTVDEMLKDYALWIGLILIERRDFSDQELVQASVCTPQAYLEEAEEVYDMEPHVVRDFLKVYGL
ncbi:hypothetical protein D3C76_965220 [compost metagenome]